MARKLVRVQQHAAELWCRTNKTAASSSQIKRLALDCWRLFDLRGYVRVDFRVDRAGQPWILEINANPCLSPEAGYAAALDEAGVSYDEADAADSR